MSQGSKIFDFENSVIFTNELSEETSTTTLQDYNSSPKVQTLPQSDYRIPEVQALPSIAHVDYEKISIHAQLAQIDVNKNWEINEQRLEYERKKNDIKTYHQEKAKMISYEISQDALKQIRYASIGEDDKAEICSKVLLNVSGYKAVLFQSHFQETHIVLKISWEGGDAVYLENGSEGISTRIFLKRLKAKGVVLRVSKRYESAVADALLSYSLNTAGECEIPWCLGWNKMENGLWHFAHENEITMKEVLKYV